MITPSQAIILKNKKGKILKVVTPYDNDETLKNPIQSLGNENNKTLKSMFKAFGDAYFTHRTCPNQ